MFLGLCTDLLIQCLGTRRILTDILEDFSELFLVQGHRVSDRGQAVSLELAEFLLWQHLVAGGQVSHIELIVRYQAPCEIVVSLSCLPLDLPFVLVKRHQHIVAVCHVFV